KVLESESQQKPPPTARHSQALRTMSCRETVLAELPGESDHERLLVVHRVTAASVGPQASQIELRQQTWAEKIGWFTQSSVQLTPNQLGALRLTLGRSPHTARPASASGFVPRVF